MRNRISSGKSFIPINRCIACGSLKHQLFLKTPDRNYNTGNFFYVQCNKCHLVWLTPRPTAKTLNHYYPLSYPAYKKQQSLRPIQIFFRKLIKQYKLIALFFIKEQLFYWKNKGRILDVGTGNGTFLPILKAWGWNPYGIELNKEAVKRAKQFGIPHIIQGTIQTAKFNNDYFDVIRYSHVLEHVPSPSLDLKAAHKLLRKGGSLILTVPNINSIFFKLFKSYWYPLEPPRHLYQFSAPTITQLLTKHKFMNIKIKSIQSPNPVVWSIKYIFGMDNVEKKLKHFNVFLGLLLIPLTWFQVSDIIEVTAQKE